MAPRRRGRPRRPSPAARLRSPSHSPPAAVPPASPDLVEMGVEELEMPEPLHEMDGYERLQEAKNPEEEKEEKERLEKDLQGVQDMLEMLQTEFLKEEKEKEEKKRRVQDALERLQTEFKEKEEKEQQEKEKLEEEEERKQKKQPKKKKQKKKQKQKQRKQEKRERLCDVAMPELLHQMDGYERLEEGKNPEEWKEKDQQEEPQEDKDKDKEKDEDVNEDDDGDEEEEEEEEEERLEELEASSQLHGCEMLVQTTVGTSSVVPLVQTHEEDNAHVQHTVEEVLHTKLIEFLGRRKRIVLQNKNGPCSLVAICNYLILTDQMVLRDPLVKIESLLDPVFSRVFPLMKNDDYDAVLNALKQTSTGLDIDLYFTRFDSFDENVQYSIFKALGIPLYHAWVNDPDVKISDAQFISSNPSQITQYGLSQLQNEVDVKLFVFFQNNHFSIVYKHNGVLYNLQTDEGFLATESMWFRIDDVHGNGVFVNGSFFKTELKVSSSKSAKLKSGGDYAITSSSFRRKGSTGFENAKGKRRGGYARSSLERRCEIKKNSSFLAQSEATSTHSGLQSASTSIQSGLQFASFFSEERDEKLGRKVLDFLRGYTENGVQYYKSMVNFMKDVGSSELRVFYDHVLSFDSDLAKSLPNLHLRLRDTLNHAAHLFIKELEAELGFQCENPTFRIVELPHPDSWVPLNSFFALPGNHPSQGTIIYCDESCLNIPETTPIGRIVLRNLFSTLTKAFRCGFSWGGNWTITDVLVNEKLEVIIAAPYCERTTRHTIGFDLARCATDVLTEYVVDGNLPALFMHLEKTLQGFIPSYGDAYSKSMLKKFSVFIAAHPALKSPLTNLAFIDGIYSVHQSLSRWGRRLLHRILYSENPDNQWTAIFSSENSCDKSVPAVPENSCDKSENSCDKSENSSDKSVPAVPKILWTVWNHWKEKMMSANRNEIGDEDVYENPYTDRAVHGLIFLRHVRHHWMENNDQHLNRLSDIHLITSYFMGDLLPEIVHLLLDNLNEFHDEYGENTYNELLGWLNEHLEFYNHPEIPNRLNEQEFYYHPEIPKR